MYVYDVAHAGPFARRLAAHEAPRHRVNGPGLADQERIDMTQDTDHEDADRRMFVVDDVAADAFEVALNRPPVDKPRLKALLNAADPTDAGVSR